MEKCPWAAYNKARNWECPAPLKVDEDKCRRLCLYWRDEKCSYKEIVAEKEKESMREFAERGPELAKRAARKVGIDEETVKEIERAVSKFAKDEGGWLGKLKRKLGR